MKHRCSIQFAGLLLALSFLPATLRASDSAVVQTEFIYDTAPFAQCHASTIVETPSGLVAAWFGGTTEGASDVAIWLSRQIDGHWTAPQPVADGVQPDGSRFPCYNPVLFQPRTGPLMLFYKVGKSPSTWRGLLRTSADAGKTWSDARSLPDGILGPIKDKPVELSDGTILCPSSSEDHGWQIHFERTHDGGRTWDSTPPINDGKAIGAIQPTILFHPGGKLEAIGRTRNNRIFETWSSDAGLTWTPVALTDLPNPNSGIDAVTLKDGRHLLVYNPLENRASRGGRSLLSVAISDDGKIWKAMEVLEDEPGKEFSYPAVIQSADGLVHITYSWRRLRVKHAVIDPSKLSLR